MVSNTFLNSGCFSQWRETDTILYWHWSIILALKKVEHKKPGEIILVQERNGSNWTTHETLYLVTGQVSYQFIRLPIHPLNLLGRDIFHKL